jgi:hypothetical protein
VALRGDAGGEVGVSRASRDHGFSRRAAPRPGALPRLPAGPACSGHMPPRQGKCFGGGQRAHVARRRSPRLCAWSRWGSCAAARRRGVDPAAVGQVLHGRESHGRCRGGSSLASRSAVEPGVRREPPCRVRGGRRRRTNPPERFARGLPPGPAPGCRCAGRPWTPGSRGCGEAVGHRRRAQLHFGVWSNRRCALALEPAWRGAGPAEEVALP